MTEKRPQVLVQAAVDQYQSLIGRMGRHAIVVGDQTYEQPHVYLSFHLLQMRVAGWRDMDFDQVAAVSGASALFAYQPGEFMPKYAHLHVNPDQRIAEATGFGYEWLSFAGADGAWDLIRESVDSGRPAKGWDWENILFVGYQEAATAADRQVFAIADGPETYARWLSWAEFSEWVQRVVNWKQPRLGRHTARMAARPSREVALQVMRDLVAWSVEPPPDVRKAHPQAAFGLAGIEAYATACERSDAGEDWLACHNINGQWAVRNSSGVYLRRVAQAAIFSDGINRHLFAAAQACRAAYESWRELYDQYAGHGVPLERRMTKEHHLAGAAAVRRGLAHERAALTEVEHALAALAQDAASVSAQEGRHS